MLAKIENRPRQLARNEFLRAYRDTPHSSTGVAPNRQFFAYPATTSQLENINVNSNTNQFDLDAAAKKHMKDYADKRRRLRNRELRVGDLVLFKQKRTKNRSQGLNLRHTKWSS